MGTDRVLLPVWLGPPADAAPIDLDNLPPPADAADERIEPIPAESDYYEELPPLINPAHEHFAATSVSMHLERAQMRPY